MTDPVTAKWVRNKSDEAAVDAGCRFDPARAERVRAFCRKFLRHSKGQWAGKPVEFMDWQWDRIVAPAFGWVMPDDTRRFRTVGCGMPKKNGKSTLLSALGLYLLAADNEPGAEVYIAAADRDQARIIYNESANMVDASPLKRLLRVRRSRSTIDYPKSRSVFKALSSESNTKEGFNIHALLFDELHAQPDDELWSVLRYGGAARRQPMLWWISTAGEADETLLWSKQWAYARAVQRGEIVDISYLGVIYEADAADDWTREETWRKANPSYGLTLNTREFEEIVQRAKNDPVERIKFLRYRLNVATKAETKWLDTELWTACGADYTLDDLKGMECVAGFDLAETTDMVAFVLVFRDDTGAFYLWPMFWVSERSVADREKRNKQRYDAWVKSGHLTVTTGEPIVDERVVLRDILRVIRRVQPAQVVIDRWHATQMAYKLRRLIKKHALPTKVNFFRFNFASISPAMKEMTAQVLCKRLRHPRNPVLDWNFANTVVSVDSGGNQKPDRGKAKDKIDGVAASLIGMAYLIEQDKDGTKYDRQGLSSV